MKFTKMQGCGNDYVYVNCFEENLPQEERPAFSQKVSDRHFGAGSDGLICSCPSGKADFLMDMYNADGSRAEMCGNGIRCVAKYVYERGMAYSFHMPAYHGHGMRGSLMARADVGKRLMVAAKVGMTAYFDRDTIGSGYRQVDGSTMVDIDLQARWSF